MEKKIKWLEHQIKAKDAKIRSSDAVEQALNSEISNLRDMINSEVMNTEMQEFNKANKGATQEEEEAKAKQDKT